MRASALFGEKKNKQTSDLSKFMMCPHGQGGGGRFFTILCGRPLWRPLMQRFRFFISNANCKFISGFLFQPFKSNVFWCRATRKKKGLAPIHVIAIDISCAM